MPYWLRTLFGILVVVLLITGPVGYAVHIQADLRNFRTVHEDVLYRSGQMTLAGLKREVNDHQIRTVISLRDAAIPGETPPDLAEEEYCRKEEIAFYRLPPRNWWAAAGPAPVDENVQKFLKVLADPANHPVLIHCFAGIHRTGAFCAIYRMEYEHWTNAQAIAELRHSGYDHLDEEWDILGYLEEYRPSWTGPPDKAPQPRKRPPNHLHGKASK